MSQLSPFGENVRIAHFDTGYTDHPEPLHSWSNNLSKEEKKGASDREVYRNIEGKNFNHIFETSSAQANPANADHGTRTASVLASGKKRGVINGVASQANVMPFRMARNKVWFPPLYSVNDGLEEILTYNEEKQKKCISGFKIGKI